MYLYSKNYLPVAQLLQKLIDSNMTVSCPDEAINALTTIGYYRLKGYCFHKYDQTTNQYLTGTNFTDVLKLYYFDSELSQLIFCFLSQIEIALRVRLVNAFQSTNDSLILNDPSAFDDKELYWKNQGAVVSEIIRSNDVFIKHNFYRHDGAIPIWATVEVMSFGTLSKLIKNLKTGNQSTFSFLVQNYKFKNANGNKVNPSKDMFTSWTQAVSIMRNICAHNSRIYNRSISTRPQLISTDLVGNQPKYNGLYQIMLAMKYLRPTDDSWNNFIITFKKLLFNSTGVYELSKINFPNDWETHFMV